MTHRHTDIDYGEASASPPPVTLTLTPEELAALARIIDPLFREDPVERAAVQKVLAAATVVEGQ